MPRVFDEISLQFWDANKKQVGSSKSYTCYHEGYVYGDEMSFENIEYVYRKDGHEEHYTGIKSGPKWAYFAFVQAACRRSEVTLQNFLTNAAEKFRIYTEAQVHAFSTQKKNSTRIKDQSCLITVADVKYYVANNLKVCEYFNSAAMNIDSSEKGDWFIRIYFDDTVLQRMEDREESEEVNSDLQTYTIKTVTTPTSSGITHPHSPHSTETIVKIDYEALNQLKKKIGDLGEAIVLDYEYKRLVSLGRRDLADRIEHTSKVKGDNVGYDILSYSEDGNTLYIEVKTTKQNKIADFYLSENERVVGNQKLSEGMNYRIYRIYNLNPVTGTGDLAIYEPPFDTEHYSMRAENWRIQLKE